ncbi:nitroreductase family protein [Desulfotruncus arcticus]|nr:nitroreductase family protein [Desulfotruncus arcticus]
MDLLDVIKARRSVRSFTDEPVSEDMLRRLVEAGCWAPSGSNAQAWEFIVIKDSKQMKKVLRFSPGLFEVPAAMIFVCLDKNRAYAKGGELGRDLMGLFDVAMASQNILLQAHAMGLGTCVLKGFDQEAIHVLLEFPENISPELLIITGYPKKIPNAPRRRPLEEVIHWERWGGGQ